MNNKYFTNSAPTKTTNTKVPNITFTVEELRLQDNLREYYQAVGDHRTLAGIPIADFKFVLFAASLRLKAALN